MSSQAAAQPDVPVDRLMRERERWGSRAGWGEGGRVLREGWRTRDTGLRSMSEILV